MKNFSFFTYMAGDNNLSDYGMRDIEEMQVSGSSPKTNVIVEIDQEGDFDGVIRYEISEKDPRTGKADRIVKERIGEKDSGDPKTLVEYLKWARSLYPAEKYFVVVWNHGSGFRNRLRALARGISINANGTVVKNEQEIKESITRSGRSTLFHHDYSQEFLQSSVNLRAIASDDMTGNSLDMIELRSALTKAGFSGAKKIEVLGFDACLMNLLEVAYEMSSCANFLVGSEELEPGDGWPYNTDTQTLNTYNGNTKQLVTNFVKNYHKYYQSRRNQWPITQSGINLAEIGSLSESLNGLGKSLSNVLPDSTMKISDIRESVQAYAIAEDYDDYVDLGDLADLFVNNMDDDVVISAAKNVQRDLKKVVIAEAHLGEEVKNSYGLTIWFPETAHKYHAHKLVYNKLLMTKKYPEWTKFLAKYHPAKPKGKELKRSKKVINRRIKK
ncbi:MAG TPA: clostripain-related cysteine peptidase [Nitrososphaeraceae archaeon]|nr:clostripain-related cysteine peptidase [Nitrososphaeraceae archaeon]